MGVTGYMKTCLFSQIILLFLLLGMNSLAEEERSFADFLNARKSASDIIEKRVVTIEPISTVQKYGDTPVEYVAAIGIMNYYKTFKSPVFRACLDHALSQKGGVDILNKNEISLLKAIKQQENKELEIIRATRNEKGIKINEITLDATVSLYLFEENKSLPVAINTYLRSYLMYCQMETMTPTTDSVILCLDDEVPFILNTPQTVYLVLGYIDDSKSLKLIAADMNKAEFLRTNPILERLEKAKTMKNRKKAEAIIKEYESRVNDASKTMFTVDYRFSLKTAQDKPYIKIIDWTPSPDQKMTIIYPPKCDKDAMSKFLKIELLGVTF